MLEWPPPAPRVEPAPLAPSTPLHADVDTNAKAEDFSDADFAQADQPELGERVGGSSRSDDLWLFLFFYYLFFIFFAPFDYSPHGGCAPSHHGHSGGGHRH